MDRLPEAAANVRACIDAINASLRDASPEAAAALHGVRYLAAAVDLILAEMTEQANKSMPPQDQPPA